MPRGRRWPRWTTSRTPSRTCSTRPPTGPPATAGEAKAFGQRVGAVAVQVTALEAGTRQVQAAATAALEGLRLEAEAAEVVAGAARGLLQLTGGRQAGLTALLDQAATSLRQARPAWWPAVGTELTMAHVQAAAGELAGAPERVGQATRELGEAVTDVLSAARGGAPEQAG